MGKEINGIVCSECEKPELVRFAKGECVEGLLLERNRVTIGGNPAIQYLVEKANGRLVKFNGTSDIVEKMQPRYVGHFIRVTYVGEDTTVKRGDNYMRVFEIFVSDWPVARDLRTQTFVEIKDGGGQLAPVGQTELADGTQITDEDIPF